MEHKDPTFTVYAYSLMAEEDAHRWVHWSNGLNMVISKGGVTIELDSSEIEELVGCLPRTIGGSY